jgi:hypothetical protein
MLHARIIMTNSQPAVYIVKTPANKKQQQPATITTNGLLLLAAAQCDIPLASQCYPIYYI